MKNFDMRDRYACIKVWLFWSQWKQLILEKESSIRTPSQSHNMVLKYAQWINLMKSIWWSVVLGYQQITTANWINRDKLASSLG